MSNTGVGMQPISSRMTSRSWVQAWNTFVIFSSSNSARRLERFRMRMGSTAADSSSVATWMRHSLG